MILRFQRAKYKKKKRLLVTQNNFTIDRIKTLSFQEIRKPFDDFLVYGRT